LGLHNSVNAYQAYIPLSSASDLPFKKQSGTRHINGVDPYAQYVDLSKRSHN
jgi:hypothetical protein